MTGEETTTALVLAGSRRGEADPVARYRHAPAKCLVTAGGVPMLARVVRTLRRSPRIGQILISADDPLLLDRVPELRDVPRLELLESAVSLSGSVQVAFDASGPPLLVTTADHALLEPAMVDQFLDRADACGADVAAALVAATTIRASHPDTKRTYLRFRDGGYSGANLFLLQTAAASQGIAFWRRIERDRKAPWRLARALGPLLLLSYLLRVATLAQAMRLVSAKLGLDAVAVVLPMAEAAIDVDKPSDLDLVERILAARGGASA